MAERADALSRLSVARTAHLATVRPDGRPHVVVITFAVVGGHVVTAVDHKPKTTQRLQRVRNIEAGSDASVLVDHFEEDWSKLWWVRVDGTTRIHRSGRTRDDALNALVDKYGQYGRRRPEGPVISVTIDRVTSWESTQ